MRARLLRCTQHRHMLWITYVMGICCGESSIIVDDARICCGEHVVHDVYPQRQRLHTQMFKNGQNVDSSVGMSELHVGTLWGKLYMLWMMHVHVVGTT